MLSLNSVSKSFGARKAVSDVSFEVQRGEFFGLLGPNGAGKTTTISMIVGTLAADSGELQLEGEVMSPVAFSQKSKIGFVPQEIALYEDLSANANLQFFGSLYGLSNVSERCSKVLRQVGLEDRATERVEHFSGGMKRRLNIAVALLHEPKLLVLDEPTVGVDPQSRNQIFDTLEVLNRDGMTILYTSHYMEEVERLCSRIAIMDGGKLIAGGTKAEISNLLPDLNLLALTFAEPPPGDLMASLMLKYPNLKVEESVVTVQVTNLENDVAWITSQLSGKASLKAIRSDESSLEDVFLHLTGKGLRD
ncbi:MAG: ABC transporter ATP-binding protein [Armatimonadota bacterium]